MCRGIQGLTSVSACLSRVPESGIVDLLLPLVSNKILSPQRGQCTNRIGLTTQVENDIVRLLDTNCEACSLVYQRLNRTIGLVFANSSMCEDTTNSVGRLVVFRYRIGEAEPQKTWKSCSPSLSGRQPGGSTKCTLSVGQAEGHGCRPLSPVYAPQAHGGKIPPCCHNMRAGDFLRFCHDWIL